MTKITPTKFARSWQFKYKDKKGRERLLPKRKNNGTSTSQVKLFGYSEPKERIQRVIEHKGKEMKVMMSEGQIINPAKEYKRQLLKGLI